MYAFLKAVIIGALGSILGRLGFRIAVGAALAALIDSAVDALIGRIEGLPDMAQVFLGASGVIEGLAIILSAIATKAALRPVTIVAGSK